MLRGKLAMNEAINYYLSAVAMFEDEVEDSGRNLHSHQLLEIQLVTVEKVVSVASCPHHEGPKMNNMAVLEMVSLIQ